MWDYLYNKEHRDHADNIRMKKLRGDKILTNFVSK
jgi:hypothetical protein